ncbi:MAG: acyl-CoA thioesterase [Bacteroidetes bacterium]|nr:acyl-CoA thioesterase [Bacteroidota bacterium]
MLEELNLYAVKMDIRVQWNDLDASQQVNSTRFFSWFENARVEYFIRLGLDIIDNDEEPGFLVKQQMIAYQSAVTFPDTVVVGIRAVSADQDKIELEAAFYSRRHHTLVARASVTMVAFQYQTKTSVNIPENIQRRISQLDQIQVDTLPIYEKFDINTTIPEFSDEEITREWMGEMPGQLLDQ